MKRSTFIKSLAALPLAALGLPPARAQSAPDEEDTLYKAARQEKSLVWYVSAPIELMQGVADAFEKKYPGIKVSVLRIVGVAQYQRFVMETEAKQYLADVLSNSDEPSMSDLIDRGDILDWKSPAHDRYPADMRLKTFAYAPGLSSDVIIYNSNRVTPEEANLLAVDWKNLIDPRFKGRLSATDQKTGGTYAGIHMLLDPKFKGRYGVPFLTAVAAQKITVYNDTVVVADRVAAGESDIGILVGEAGGATTQWAHGAPIRWVFPKPTPVWGGYWQGISKFAPHPNAAKLFQNWSTGEGGVAALQNPGGNATTLLSFPDTRAVAKAPWYGKITESYSPDWARWAANFDKDMALWLKLLKSGGQ